MLQILRNNYNIYKCYFLQKIFLSTLLLTVFSSSLSAHEGCNLLPSEKSNRIKVLLPENPEDRLMLIGALEIDHYYTENGYLITEVSESNAKKLKSLPFK